MPTVILLDDDAQIRQYFAEYLRAYGYTVVEGVNSKGILQLVREHQAKILITDLMMPDHEGMEGIFLARQIPDLRIIAISSNAAFLHLAFSIVDACMQKPILGSDLVLQVEKLLNPTS